MARCCPYYVGGGCRVAAVLRLCSGASELTGSCVTVEDRCCGVTPSGIQLWETCRLYMHASDCRYCRHYDRYKKWCKEYNKEVKRYIGTCPKYDGPKPVPSLVGQPP